MLSLQANAVTVKPNGIGAPKMPADGHAWRCRAGTTSHRGRFRRETSLLGLFGDGRQGYSAPKARQLAVYLENVGLSVSGLPDPAAKRAITPCERTADNSACCINSSVV